MRTHQWLRQTLNKFRQTLNKLILHRAEVILITLPLAETGMVSGPPTTVNRLSVGASTKSKVAKAIILSTFPSEASDSKPSRLEVICRSNQARGFSEQMSNRIAVPQIKSTLDLYEQKWNTFRQWCSLNEINPHMPTVPMISCFTCLGTNSWQR